jgi:hypothetical protein
VTESAYESEIFGFAMVSERVRVVRVVEGGFAHRPSLWWLDPLSSVRCCESSARPWSWTRKELR